jgi:molybdopterin molybdotransferase
MLNASLSLHGILPSLHHLPDDPDLIKRELEVLIGERDVLIMSGGVSRGKFDCIPQVLKELDVQKLFHRVRQRPGKPFWYGIHKSQRCWIFSFPGNPVSTFVNYHIYFNSWLRRSLGLANPEIKVALTDDIAVEGTLTRFIRVQTSWDKGGLTAKFINSNGSGDLISLAAADGFIRLKARKQPYKSQDLVPFIPTKPYL